MQEISQSFITKFKGVVETDHKFTMHLHPGPDADCVGSTLAMKLALEALGKEAVVIQGDDAPAQKFHVIPGFNDIVSKNFFDLNESDTDVYLSLDSGATNQISKLDEVVFPDSWTVVNIDHHISNDSYGDLNLVLSDVPATCQILYTLFVELNWDITPEIAKCLLAGIYGDTRFIYSSVLPSTFEIAGKLLAKVPDYYKVVQMLESQLKKHVVIKGIAFANASDFGSKRVGASIISYQDLQNKHIDKDDVAGTGEIASELLRVQDWRISFCIIEKEPNSFSISFRSNNPEKYPVHLIASATGKGGGHAGAGGAKMEGSLGEVKERLMSIIKEVHPRLYR